MSPKRWSPKRWLRPRSRRWREHLDEHGEPLTATEILRTLYPDGYEPPKWAREAHKHGWMTIVALCRLPVEEWEESARGRIQRCIYESSPFLRLCRKSGSDFQGAG